MAEFDDVHEFGRAAVVVVVGIGDLAAVGRYTRPFGQVVEELHRLAVLQQPAAGLLGVGARGAAGYPEQTLAG